MQKEPTVSVAMTTYKSKKYIREQLASIFTQTVLPDELIICDDASPDDTVEYIIGVLEELAKPSVAINLRRNEVNLGYQANFEQAMTMCTGDIIISCDADDVWAPQKVEIIRSQFKNPGVSAVFHDAEIINEHGTVIHGSVNNGWDTRGDKADSIALARIAIRRRGCPNGMCCAFSKDLVSFALPFSRVIGHDEWLTCTAPLFGAVVCLPDILTQYRRHSSNTSGNKLTAKQRLIQLNREGWFTHASQIQAAFCEYLERYSAYIPASLLKTVERQITFQADLKHISEHRGGILRLLKTAINGSYFEFRGTRNTFFFDLLYLLIHFFSKT